MRLTDWLSPAQPLWKTIAHEGISLLKQKPLAELLGFKPQVIFWYNLARLKPIAKVKFSYALLGRAGKGGTLRELGGEYLGKGVILVPVETEDHVRDSRRRLLVEM